MRFPLIFHFNWTPKAKAHTDFQRTRTLYQRSNILTNYECINSEVTERYDYSERLNAETTKVSINVWQSRE